MRTQITRNNHYVPQWYQRGFLPRGQAMLHVLDVSSTHKPHNGGSVVSVPRPRLAPPSRVFCERDLYTTRFGDVLNDDIEKFLFGTIDKWGAEAIRALVENNPSRIRRYFRSLFEYIDAQKIRTPKGLDWILANYRDMAQVDLMVEMQGLRDMHCKMWTECVREIVSAASSCVKFIVSDHPVTIFHREIPPDSKDCGYPQDPGIELIGSQTIFPLDCDHCLILTNLEYAQSPNTADVMARRTNARARGQGLARADAFIRTRELSADEVVAINHVLKSRARKFIAAGSVEWLNPETENSRDWREIGEILLPRDELWRFGGEIYVGYTDGTTHYQDAFGRKSRAHEYLSKRAPTTDPDDDAGCPCGSGATFGQCCKCLSLRDRPSWTSYSVRERNLMLCSAIRGVLGLDTGKSWKDVRRELSNEQVKKIHQAFESLWPQDTLLREIIPRPRSGVLRALYIGHLDPRTLATVATSWLDYFDELVLSHPFVHPATVKPEYSPTQSPGSYKDQTLRNALTLLELESHISAGLVHLIPDPADLEPPFRDELFAIGKRRAASVAFSKEDSRLMDVLMSDDFRRWTLRGSDEQLARIAQSAVPGTSPENTMEVIRLLRKDLEDDPLALLQPIVPGEEGAQLLAIKGFTVETGLYLASLTGSIIYCLFDATWNLLHEQLRQKDTAVADNWSAPIQALGELRFILRGADEPVGSEAQVGMDVARSVLAKFVLSARSGAQNDLAELSDLLDRSRAGTKVLPRSASCLAEARLRASVPIGGFHRREVTRLILTYGLTAAAQSVPVALQLRLNMQ